MDSLPPGVPLSEIPALKPPPGIKPNFVNPPSYANALVTVNAVFLTLMLITLALRLYTKGVLLKSLGWDDCKSSIPSKGFRLIQSIKIQP